MKVSKEVWVIMDKNKKAIGCGVPRNRSMRMLGEALNTRILTYQSEAKARAGFKVSGFYDETERYPDKEGKMDYWSDTYLKRTYGDPNSAYRSFSYEDICIPVKATITIEVGDDV